ncbi:hypothetical protein OESDEN_00729 [Oesophagostomum dentatum]|uniref:Receptor ligand binding region domain-containing protein n=1 Tax=Oesophagostomum dentatum TaxID=61180 RepID=A0A0B1TPW7_OESDE|nr:hypothetical protein OESDEN_00729 [Oesophagostomum dentatum]
MDTDLTLTLFRFFVNYTECDKSLAVGVAAEFMKNRDVDVVIGPPCPQCQWSEVYNAIRLICAVSAAEIVAHLSTFYKKTMLGWGFLTDSMYDNLGQFPYTTKVVPNSLA